MYWKYYWERREAGVCIMKKIRCHWFLLSGAVLVLDQLTKHWAMQALELHIPYPVLPGFNLTLIYNTGAAFSFLHHAGGWQKWFLIGLTIVLCVFLIRWILQPSLRQWTAIALSLVFGGALGNLWDRIQLGHVVDFIQLYYQHFYWPAFNLADTTITIGALMLVKEVFKT